ncbi:MAG: N-acetylmuramoyl-L-alanine amidase [Candidatus Melainabacteria bacterium]|nr:N-acetylmuramoyl-L-alanine amidase [Candidatus Melainabacteria bacterium]
MHRQLFYLSLLIPLSFVVFCDVNCKPAYAQENLGINKVSSTRILKNKDGIELATANKTPLPRPIIQFLSGENGNTVLVADFPGLIWELPTRSVGQEVFGTTSSITSIKVGRFQSSPPVCRISISARDSAILKSVAFRSTPGRLSVKIPNHKNIIAQGGLQAFPPPFAPSIGRTTPQKAGIAPPMSTMDPSLAANQVSGNSELDPYVVSQSATDNGTSYPSAPIPGPPMAPKLKAPNHVPSVAPARARAQSLSDYGKSNLSKLPTPSSQIQKTEKTPDKIAKNKGESSPGQNEQNDSKNGSMSRLLGKLKDRTAKLFSADSDSSTLAPPADTSLNNDQTLQAENSIRLKFEANQFELSGLRLPANQVTYKAFRLSNPDRYVVDFDNLPELKDATKAELPENKYVKDVRFGIVQNTSESDSSPTKGRLVFDLNDPEATFNISPESNKIVFSINSLPNGLPASSANLRGKVIVLDAGHGGTDPGAQRGITNEKDITLSVVKYLSEFLKAQGIQVHLTRTDDTFISLQERVDITNRTSPNAFVSVHVNAMESSNEISGLETYFQTEQSKELASDIHKNLLDTLKVPDRNIRKAKFYVINRTEVPSVLAEIGFISNQSEREKLISSDYQKQVAEGLAKGIILYLSSDSGIRDISKRTGGEKAKTVSKETVESTKKVSRSPRERNEKISAGNLSSLSRLAQKGLGIGMGTNKEQAHR